MGLVLSSAMASFCKTTTVFDAMQTIKAAGFDGLDFCLSVYSRPLDSPLRQASWREWIKAVRQKADALALPIVQAHASWEQPIPQDLHYESPYPIYARTFAACHALGCHKLVFHPVLYLYPIPSAHLYAPIHEFNVRWFRELLPLAQRYEITIEIENTFDYRHVQQPDDPPFTYTAAEDMLHLVRAIDSPWVKLCLDTGHANISGQDVPRMIHQYGKWLDCLHLNDNYGKISGVYEDLHLFPGSGRLDWPAIFQALRQEGFGGALNLEIVAELPRVSPAVRLRQLRAGREVTELLARQAGWAE